MKHLVFTYRFFERVLVLLFSFLILLQSERVDANISQSFPESIPFVASGRYIYDTLDYLTTPFLYGVQKTNALSIKFTRENNKEGLFAAGRVSILNFPIYLAVNLLGSNTNKSVEPKRGTGDAEVSAKNQITDYRFMIGSHWKDIGFSFYTVLSNNRTERITVESANGSETKDIEFNPTVAKVDEFFQPKGNRYGVELGQSTMPIPAAWTISIEYRTLGGTSTLVSGTEENPINDDNLGAPSTIFDEQFIPGFESTIGVLSSRNGNNREEVGSSGLFWYTLLQKKLNVGFSYALTIPFGSGRNKRLTFENPESNGKIFQLQDPNIEPSRTAPRLTTLSGYDISVTAFADVDFYFGDTQEVKVITPAGLKSSVFRITPAITYRNLQEKLFYNEGHRFQGDYEYVSLDLHFRSQVVFGEKKNIFLYLGWLPKVIFLQTYKTNTKAQARPIISPGTPDNANYERKIESPTIEFANFTIGFSYLFFDKLKLNLAWSPTAGQGGGDKIDLTKLDLGVDYSF